MTKKLKRLTLKKQAEMALREMIASYRFTPGKWINVESLAKELEVSRTPVWQALKDLEKEGLVTHKPKQGIRMVQMTLEMAHDLYTVRGLLEGMAGRLAVENISPGALKRLESILKKQHLIVQSQDVVEYSKSDFEFHALIYDSCGNWLLKELLENIKDRSRPFVCDITPILPKLLEDHTKVIEAFRNQDSTRAENVMKAHNRRMQRQIELSRLN
ncbi:MAG: GntR family transcriptional regulator [Deltaproteobacteria bacterium]|nr:GntR family transcriptional regulator [Deltaproteobacteria bacterium]